MKTKKVFNVSGGKKYKIIGLKGRDHCTCFDKKVWGVLKNGLGTENKDVKGSYFSEHTVYRCKKKLIVFFHKEFGGIWTDKRRTVEGNWEHHPEYLYFIENTKKGMKAWGKDTNFFYEYPELNAWFKTLSFDDQAIVMSYGFIINE